MRILNCTPDDELRTLRETILLLQHCEVVSVKEAGDAILKMEQGNFDALLVCNRMENEDASLLCHEFKRHFPTGKIVALETPLVRRDRCDKADYHANIFKPAEMIFAITGKKMPAA